MDDRPGSILLFLLRRQSSASLSSVRTPMRCGHTLSPLYTVGLAAFDRLGWVGCYKERKKNIGINQSNLAQTVSLRPTHDGSGRERVTDPPNGTTSVAFYQPANPSASCLLASSTRPREHQSIARLETLAVERTSSARTDAYTHAHIIHHATMHASPLHSPVASSTSSTMPSTSYRQGRRRINT